MKSSASWAKNYAEKGQKRFQWTTARICLNSLLLITWKLLQHTPVYSRQSQSTKKQTFIRNCSPVSRQRRDQDQWHRWKPGRVCYFLSQSSPTIDKRHYSQHSAQWFLPLYAVVTYEIKLFENYFSFDRRHRNEIILFQRVEACLKFFENYFRSVLKLTK